MTEKILRGPKTDERHRIMGETIRNLRTEEGITLQDMAAKLGITYQQLSKYELGTNRVDAVRLGEIADILGYHITNFYPEKKEILDDVCDL